MLKSSKSALGYKTLKHIKATISSETNKRYYLPTPPLGQDMTQGHFLSGV